MRNCTKIKQIVAFIFLVGIVCIVNPLSIAYRSGYSLQIMNNKSFYGLLGFDIICLFSLVLIVINPLNFFYRIKITNLLSKSLIFFKKNINMTIALLPIFTVFIYFYYCIANEHSLPKFNFVIFTIALQSVIISTILFFLLIILISYLRTKYLFITAFTVIYSSIIISDWVSIINGGGRLAIEMWGWVSFESVTSLMSYGLILKICTILFLIIASVIGLYKQLIYYKYDKKQITIGLIISLLLIGANPAHWFLTGITAFLSPTERLRWRINMAYENFAIDPILSLSSAITNIEKEYILTDLNPYLATKTAIYPSSPDSNSVFGKNNVKRIIFIMIESFSLNFSKKFNRQLPETLTPFFDSISNPKSFIWTTSSPTAPGIATHFCSHPNAQSSIKLGYPHSVVRNLKNNGWRTVLFQSPFENYDDGIKKFSEIGFTEHYGAEWQRINGNDSYIQLWGTCDRITYQSIVKYLSAHKDERVFITGLTIDTHFPTGRTDYRGLSYPEEPHWIKEDKAYLFLRSVFRMDYDLGLFVANLRQRNLIDKDTVLIITADHSCPPFPQLESRLGLNNSRFERIPWIALNDKTILEMSAQHIGSQQDTAPTIAYFAGLKNDPAWWGTDLHLPITNIPVVSYDHSKISVLNQELKKFQQTENNNLLELTKMFVRETDMEKLSGYLNKKIP